MPHQYRREVRRERRQAHAIAIQQLKCVGDQGVLQSSPGAAEVAVAGARGDGHVGGLGLRRRCTRPRAEEGAPDGICARRGGGVVGQGDRGVRSRRGLDGGGFGVEARRFASGAGGGGQLRC